jgi:ATP-dependent Clp protease ATP-binding subunit ClpX
VDTINILFICGGAFIGLDTLIEQRTGKRAMGFTSDLITKQVKKIGEILSLVEPEDMIKYGLIPEFVGRMPVVAALDELDEAVLIKILTEPKNALMKQYQKLLSFDNVRLKFTDGALSAIAKKAIQRKTGARGLRSILEEIMLEVMYEIPSQRGIKECLITEDTILKQEKPILVYEKQAESA